MRVLLAAAVLALAACGDLPKAPDHQPAAADGKVLAWCDSAMTRQTKISVGLFDHRIPCIIDQR